MNRRAYLFFAFTIGASLFFGSCLNDDDDDNTDQDWLSYQSEVFEEVAKDPSFTQLASQSGNGSVYWKTSTEITNSDLAPRVTAQGKPEFTDTVTVRYEGWYYFDENSIREKKIFDSTENPSLSNPNNPNKTERSFALSSVIDGWTTVLQDMQIGEERLVVMPQQLGYRNSSSSFIPAYTTLWFRIKLVNIKPLSGRK